MLNKAVACLFATLIALLSGCGGSTGSHDSLTPTSVGLPAQSTVFLVVLENMKYDDVIGNSSDPYLTGLAQSNSLASNYFADTHPSIGNYFMLTTGQIITNDDSTNPVVTSDNLVREMLAGGVSWKAYLEALPSPGFTGNLPPYLKPHDPFAYFSDVINDPAQLGKLVPYSQLAADLASNSLPRFVYIKPDDLHDMHDCPDSSQNCVNGARLSAADNWLRTHVQPILDSPAFQAHGVMIITFDEAAGGDNTNGGGHVATILIGPQVKKGYVSTSLYQHESTLRLICELLGVPELPGNAAGAPRMTEFFVGQ